MKKKIIYNILFTLISVIIIANSQLHAQPGALDKSFGTDGKAITLISGINNELYKITIQKDNKIVAASVNHIGFKNDPLVVRYLENGIIDSSFGINGYSTINDGLFSIDCCIAIQDDGKILVGGTTNSNEVIIYRFMPDGDLDNSFGSKGVTINNLGGETGARDIAILPDGKILVGGSFYAFKTENFKDAPFAARFNADGSLDSSFGKSGRCIVDSGGNAQCIITSMVVGKDGRIILAGDNAQGTSSSTLIFVAAITAEGKTDKSFNQNGYTYTNISWDGDGKRFFELIGSGESRQCSVVHLFLINTVV